jgi:hypothetical protein
MSAVSLAQNLVNTATRRQLTAEELHAALLDAAKPGQAQVRILLEEAPRSLLMELVGTAWISWQDLAGAAGRVPYLGGWNGAWIQEMAGFALARTAR